MGAHDLADFAADKLDRLADDLDAADSVTLSGAPEPDRERAQRTIADSRNEAAGALERLGDCDDTAEPEVAFAQMAYLRSEEAAPVAGAMRKWAAAWRAFADGGR